MKVIQEHVVVQEQQIGSGARPEIRSRLRLRVKAVFSAAGALMSLGAAAQAALPPYAVTTIGNVPGAVYTWVSGLSENGQVVGSAVMPGNVYVAWVYRSGMMTVLPGAGGTYTKGYAVNDAGWVVGEATTSADGPSRAVLWRPDQPPEILGTLGGTTSYASAINNRNQIVGGSQTAADLATHGFYWENSVVTDLGTLPGGASNTISTAHGINENSWVVGRSAGTNGAPNPFSYYAGALYNLAPTSTGGEAISISNTGTIVGLMKWGRLDQATMFRGPGVTTPINLGRLAGDSEGAAHDVNDANVIIGNSASSTRTRATIWTNGTPSSLRDLNTFILPSSGWSLTSAMRINNAGQIVGNGVYGGVNAIFLVAPRCVADVDDGTGAGTPDGGVGVEDLLRYIVLYTLGSTDADTDSGAGNGVRDGAVGVEDLLYFLQRFEAGC